MEIFLAGTLAIFTIASVLYQIPSFNTFLLKYDVLGVLPNYTFFAPNPYTRDFRLVYKMSENEEGEWNEYPMYIQFSILRMLWNPFKYYNKGMIDTCQFLLIEYNALKDKNHIQVSTNYINILLSIRELVKSCSEKSMENLRIRFAIVSSEGLKCAKIENIIFVSFYQKL